MFLGEIIKEYRREHSLSMAEFADKSGISKAYVSLLEKNRHPRTGQTIAPSIETIRKAAKAMNMSFDDLFDLLNCDVVLSSTAEESQLAEQPFSDSYLDANKTMSFEELRTAYARNRHGLTKDERMRLAAEILADEENL